MADFESWERKTLEKLALSALQEQRRARQWSIFFRLLTLVFLFILLFAIMGWFNKGETPLSGKHTALVELRGVIAVGGDTDADRVISGLREAFNIKGSPIRLWVRAGSENPYNDKTKRRLG